jgi:hypothetical protein
MHIYKTVSSNLIIRMTDNASIPADPANADYALYLQEVSEGATVLPVDPIDPNIAIMGQISSIESTTMVPRITREFMMRTIEDYANRTATTDLTAAQILAKDFGYQRIKAVDDQVKKLRASLV